LAADQAVLGNAVEQIFIQHLLSLESYDCAGTLPSQRKDCTGDLHQIKLRAVPLALAPEQISQETEAIECLPDLSLEDYYQKDKQHRPQFLEDPTGHEQPKILGDDIQNHQKSQSYYDLQGLGVLEPAVQLVNQKTHDEYVCYVLRAKVVKQRNTSNTG
jgi:hypothetical protein